MAVTYGTSLNSIPGDEITVAAGNTVNISIGFNATVGIVGSYDSANGSANVGNVVEVSSTRDAREKFGQDSELHKTVEQVYANGAVTVFAVPLPETSNTESVSGTSGTLSENPIFDSRVTTHDISVQDTTDSSSENVVISYEDTLTQADSGDFKVNPLTGDWQDDGDGNNYDITYEYTTQSEWDTAVEDIVKENIRVLCLLTETEGRINKGASEARNRANEFDFLGVVAGATPERQPGSYTDNLDDRRVSVVAPARAFDGQDGAGEFRLASSVAGKLAGKQLGDTTTFETLDNIVSLNTEYTNSDANDWVNKQVLPVIQDRSIKVVKDMTTSQETKFERVYAREIVDDATEGSHIIAQEFIGELNTQDNRDDMRDEHVNLYNGFIENEPTLLDAFDVTVAENDTNSDAVDVEIGLNVVDVIDRVNVNISVGDVITQQQG